MAAAVHRAPMVSRHRTTQSVSPPTASSSRSPQPLNITPSDVPDATMRTFHRLRQSLRTATRSKTKSPSPGADDFATLTTSSVASTSSAKGKERAVAEEVPKEKAGMLKRLQSKVNLRKSGRESTSPTPPPVLPNMVNGGGKHAKRNDEEKVRQAGNTSYETPSLRQASKSSPVLQLYTQGNTPSKSRSAIPDAALASHPKERLRRVSHQPISQVISGPVPLAPRRDSRSNTQLSSSSQSPPKDPPLERRSSKSRPSPKCPPSSSAPSLATRTSSPPPQMSTRRHRERPNSPPTPTPPPKPPGIYSGSTAKRNPASSAGHLPLNNPPLSPASQRATSPIQPLSPTSNGPSLAPHRRLTSSSATNLTLRTNSPSTRPSLDIQTSSTPLRPSIITRNSVQARRPSLETQHFPSSPTSARPRAISPPYAQNRHVNMSSASLSTPVNAEHREAIRTAASLLCREVLKPPSYLGRNESSTKEWDDVERRMQALARLERIWGKSGGIGGGSTSQVNGVGTGSGFTASGAERERSLFGEALKDGYVLCQILNKLRSHPIIRADPREDGFVRTSNVTKFLAACSTFGVPTRDLFRGDDLMEASSESLARVARTVIALFKQAESPVITDHAKIISGQAKKDSSGPYGYGTTSRGASSTPNLTQLQRSTSPTSPSSPIRPKRWSPPVELPTVRSNSPGEGSSNSGHSTETADDSFRYGSIEQRSISPGPLPPPKSPLRPRTSSILSGSPPDRSSLADSMRASAAESIRASVTSGVRQSVASSSITESTAFTNLSLLEVRRNNSSGNTSGNTKYGTVRTMTTDATSEAPSFGRAEGGALINGVTEDTGRKRVEHVFPRDRRQSDVGGVDLTRVAEEFEDSSSGSSARRQAGKPQAREVDEERARHERIRLGKGKWPEDFENLEKMNRQSGTRPIPIKASRPMDINDLFTLSSSSPEPPRKLAVIDASHHNESLESLPVFPRRPTHRARHSIDTPVLLPKEDVLRRDASPDGLVPSRVMMRRHSTKTGPHRGVYLPRGRSSNSDSPSPSRDLEEESRLPPIPFPKGIDNSLVRVSSSSQPSSSEGPKGSNERPRLVRGRFQSEVDPSSLGRRTRPTSYDELGAKPTRSRFESMINLGVVSSNAMASDLMTKDLMTRDSMDGSAVRRTLIVKEEGKPPTHFQLGNCIGRGQFGSVYRALNLNTGQMVAVKRIRLEGLKEDEVMQLMREVDLVKRLSHPSIVKYEGMSRDEDTLNIVLEYAENGSLGQTLKAFGKLNEKLVASYVVKILEGLDYLHQSDVVHCDLKAANILTTKTGNVKLSDFGVSLNLRNLRAMEQEIQDVAGTPNWMAPEVIELKGASTKSDIWSLACTVIELLTGRPPYAEIANSMSVMFRIVEDDIPPIPEGCSDSLRDFLTQCFNKDPAKRPSAELLCEHQWLRKNWAAHKELRPQDSIPFLRRVSADLHKSDATRAYLSQVEMPNGDTLITESPLEVTSPHPIHRHLSNGPGGNMAAPREHSFVKTTFSKAMICRVCLEGVKKSAVLCEQCNLIAHSKCAANSPPTCDLRAQLLLFAQYAEKGNPQSAYSNPLDILNGNLPTSPASDVAYISHSPSIDIPPSPGGNHLQGLKFMAAFKKPRTSAAPEPGQASSSLPTPASPAPLSQSPGRPLARKSREVKDRPVSYASTSTTPNSTSTRSAATAAESSSGRQDFNRQINASEVGTRTSASRFSMVTDSDIPSSVRMAGTEAASITEEDDQPPGHLPVEMKRPKKRDAKSANGCYIQ